MRTTQRRVVFGKGGSTKMFGKGDRTNVAEPNSAGEQTPAITSQRARTKTRFAEGGEMPRSGGRSEPVKSEHTGPPGTPARQSTRDYGGISRPAKPGRCAPG